MDMREGPVDANALQALRGAAEELPVAPESVQGDGEATSSQGRVLFYAANNGMEGPAHPAPPIVAAGNEDLGAMRMEDDDDNSSEALPRRVVEKKTVTKGNYNYPKCQFEGCGKIRLKGGFCSQHGGGRKCESEGCTKGAAGGTAFCISHGGGKRCEEPDCNKLVRKQGFCVLHCGKHGIIVQTKMCLENDCEKQAYKKGYCCHHARLHGLYEINESGMCKFPGCTKYSQKKGFCKMHGKEAGVIFVSRSVCLMPDCDLISERKGYCMKHIRELGIDSNYRKCKIEGCGKHQKSNGGGFCTLHAREDGVMEPLTGSKSNPTDRICLEEGCEVHILATKKYCKQHNRERNLSDHARCAHEGCDKQQQKGMGYCIAHAKEHGISVHYERCKEAGCTKHVYRKGLCTAHGREHGVFVDDLYKRCEELECRKFVFKEYSVCKMHAKERGLKIIGGTKVCKREGCDKTSQKGGFCRPHGREAGLVMEYKRCEFGGCDKHVTKREGGKGYCTLHAREVMHLHYCPIAPAPAPAPAHEDDDDDVVAVPVPVPMEVPVQVQVQVEHVQEPVQLGEEEVSSVLGY